MLKCAQRAAAGQRYSATTKRAEIWISAVIYVLVTVVILVLVLEAGIPLINGMREKAAYSRAKETLSSLDKQIEEVAREGQGSQRVISLEVAKGEVSVQGQKLRWKLETDSKILEPRTKVDLGNLKVLADVDAAASDAGSFHIVENSRILVNFTRFGSESNWTAINTSRLINYIQFKADGSKTNGTFNLYLNGTASTGNGTGYTKLVDTGTGLAAAALLAHVNSTNFEYDLQLSLDSKADFLRTELKNVVIK